MKKSGSEVRFSSTEHQGTKGEAGGGHHTPTRDASFPCRKWPPLGSSKEAHTAANTQQSTTTLVNVVAEDIGMFY